MKAAILAGGSGKRIGTMYPDIPKPMIPLMGKPVLQYQVELLARHDITDITLITGYKSDVIMNHFNDGSDYNVHIKYIVEETPLGTGGALALLPKEDTLILFGDVYLEIDIDRFVQYHREKQAEISLFAHPNSHPHDSDIVVVTENGAVTEWASKKETAQRGDVRNLVNAGLYIFNGTSLPTGAAVFCELEHDLILPKLNDGRVFAYRSTEYVKDMGTPERLKAVTEDIRNGITAARCLKNKQKAVFIDRDGTMIKEDGFVKSPDQVHLQPGIAGAIKLLNTSHYLTICITNQPVIARGDVSFDGLEKIHSRMDSLLGYEGAYLDDLFFCPHHPDKGFDGEVPEYKVHCECRKPKPGMLLEASERYNIDLTKSYMIGDSTADIAAGSIAGCKTIGVNTGLALKDGKYAAQPDGFCENLVDAVKQILEEQV